MAEISWPQVILALTSGVDLRPEQASWALEEIMEGRASEAQVAGFLVGMRAKGASGKELNALVDVMLSHAVAVDVEQPVLDVVGTGGDQAGTVNISTMAAIVCAAAGARVVKHGNRAASSACGSADVLESLGVAIELPAVAVAMCVRKVGIGFCYAPVYHPAMRHVAPVRRELGVPTVFNILGPLANPARPKAQLIGCADAKLAPVMAEALARRGVRALVVRGNDGMDEITTAGVTSTWWADEGAVGEGLIDAAAFGLARPDPGALKGGDPGENAEIAWRVLDGGSSGRLASIRDAVAINAAAALTVLEEQFIEVGEPLPCRIAANLPRAREVMESGAAGEVLRRWIEVSRDLARLT